MRHLMATVVLCLVTVTAQVVASSSTAEAATAGTSGSVLFGDQNLESQGDAEPSGQAEAFPFTAATGGTASTITVYVGNAATLNVALYGDSGGTPGSLIASGSTNATGAGWATASIPATPITASAKYWVALLGNSSLTYRDGTSSGSYSGCVSVNTPVSEQITSFPTTFPRGATYSACPLSAYVSGSSSSSASLTASTPATTAAFTFTPTSPTTGQTVHFDGSGSACGAPPCSYAWQDDGPDGPGGTNWPLGTGSTLDFTFQQAGTKYVRLTVTDASSRSATVEHDVVVTTTTSSTTSAPSNTALPAVSGTAQQGQTLSASKGSWTGSPTSYAYQWRDCDSSGVGCSNISGASSSSYTLGSGDVGHTIDVVVTASNAGGSTSATSNPTAVVSSSSTAAPSNTALPAVSGTAQQGQTLSASKGSWTGSPTSYAYQWRDCDSSGVGCSNISGASSSSYTLGTGDVGHTIDVVVTASNAGGSTSATSNPTAVVSSSGTSSTGCFSSPASCGFPDAAAGNVGATSPCSSLTPSGSVTVSTAGATVQNLNITGSLTISAPNVTVNNVCVTYNGNAQYGATAVNLNSSGTLVENTTIGAPNNSTQSFEVAIGNNGNPVTVDHVYAHDCGECIWGSGYTLKNSYIITDGMQGTGDHMEDLYCSDGTETLTHNTLLDPEDQTATVFCDTHYGQGGACDNHITMTNNLLAGGGFIVYACGNSSSAGSSTMNISNNRIARCTTGPMKYNSSTGGTACQGSTGTSIGSGADTHGYWPDGGYFGIDAYTYCTGTGNTWSGNVWDDNGANVGC
jgi:hypothetical protein